MGEFLRRTLEAQGKSVPAPDANITHTPLAPTASRDAAMARLEDLKQQAAFGGLTIEDRRMIASLEAQISSFDSEPAVSLKPDTVLEQREARKTPVVLSPLRALLTGKL